MVGRVSVGLLSCVIGVALTGCGAQPYHEVNLFAMDTYNTISAQADSAVLDGATALVLQYEDLCSRTDPDAKLYQLNQETKMDIDELSPELLELLTTAQEIALQTDSAFDPTMAVLSDLWDFTASDPTVPSQELVQTALTQIGVEHLAIDQEQVTLQNGIQLDLGGIAKGYVTDKLVAYFQQEGVQNAIISLGGNTYVMGQKEGKPYQVGIANPFDSADLIGVLTLSDRAVVTSGDYQRYFEVDGERYHHILDRQTGMPADSDLASVTVVADSATLADAYATALYVMGLDEGLAFVESDPQLEAVFVGDDQTVTCSSGLVDLFQSKE